MDDARPQEPQQPIVPNKPAKQLKPQPSSKAPMIIMIIIAMISLTFSAYLAFQNTQLKKQTSPQQTSINESVTPTAAPTVNITKEIPSLQSNEENDVVRKIAEKCYENNDYYLIFLKITPGEYQRSIVIKNKTEADNYKCEYNTEEINYTIMGGPIRTIKLISDSLLIFSGTGPGGGGMQIYDLAKMQRIYSEVITGTEDINEKYVEYWKSTDIVATPERCPSTEAQLFEYHMVGVDQKVKFEYETREETLLEEYRCSGRQ